MVWGLGVGYVISGNYFGWNLGLEKGGTLGLAVALLFIIILYITFTLSYTELACAIPKSGGAFDFASRAFGRDVGFVVGMAQNMEFIFAPPAIAFGLGAYFNLYFPELPVLSTSIVAYFTFLLLNIAGVKIAAAFELGVTILAVAALLVFSAIVLPHFQFANMQHNALPMGWSGALAATPFAIWFFLGIEGVANLAEESVNPRRTVFIGFGSAIATLVVLCLITFASSIGIGGWEAIVFTSANITSDSPLPMAIAQAVGKESGWYQLLIFAGLFGLVASFHGLMFAAGRSTYEFGKAGYGPEFLGKLNPRFQTPSNALVFNLVFGILALLSGKTGEIITLSVFGALTLYIFSMLALLKLRKSEPDMPRPFRVPFFPLVPVVALIVATGSLIAVGLYNFRLMLIYVGVMAISFLGYKLMDGKKQAHVRE